ncbi:MAG TPA: PAS domain-containing sensor histidine kinase [Thermomicrobiales bacterium]|nr:PAS domain-containing sensor histidine kinase [Thermomicrobiales bacterium]
MQTVERAGGFPTAETIQKPRHTPGSLGFGPLFWAARDAVIVIDIPRIEMIFCNPAVETVYGYTPGELEGQQVSMLLPERLREMARGAVRSFMDDDRGRLELDTPMEIPSLHKSGEDIIVEFTVSQLDIPGEQLAFVIARDVTERKRLESERDALLADAQATLLKANELAALKSDFVAMIAHEAGNPIAAISGMMELWGRDDLQDDQRKRLSHAIRSEVRLLQRLVSDVQNATSMDRGEFSVSPEPVPLPHLIDDAILAMKDQLAMHAFTLEPVPDVTILADRERITQVLQNLLGNAVKYTPPGTPVTLRARSCDGHVHIDVIDEGSGISQEDLEHIFTKFGRGRNATGHRVPGMGLGLYLSRGIVHDHGSTLFATSAPGKGTTFSFDLAEAS